MSPSHLNIGSVQLVAVVVASLAAVVVLTLGYWLRCDRIDARRAQAAGRQRDADGDAAADRLVDGQIATRVVVSTRDGDGFAGLLVDHDARSLKLASAVGISRQGERAEVDGVVLIPRAEVRYLQRPVG